MGPYDTEGMPADESAPSEAQNAQTEPAGDDTPEEESGPEGATTLIPKSVCPGMDLEEGQILQFKVVKTYEDEAEIKYVKNDKGESEMDRSEGKLNAMAEAPPA